MNKKRHTHCFTLQSQISTNFIFKFLSHILYYVHIFTYDCLNHFPHCFTSYVKEICLYFLKTDLNNISVLLHFASLQTVSSTSVFIDKPDYSTLSKQKGIKTPLLKGCTVRWKYTFALYELYPQFNRLNCRVWLESILPILVTELFL